MNGRKLRAVLVSMCAFCRSIPAQPPSITLQEAITRARQYGGQIQSANLAVLLAKEDSAQARAGRLPTLNAFNQFIYTEGNGTPSGVFVANDGVHIYNEQAAGSRRASLRLPPRRDSSRPGRRSRRACQESKSRPAASTPLSFRITTPSSQRSANSPTRRPVCAKPSSSSTSHRSRKRAVKPRMPT